MSNEKDAARRGEAQLDDLDSDRYGYIVEPDMGKHFCCDPDCRSCHNCGVSDVNISGPWNLCDACDDVYIGGEKVNWDEEAEDDEWFLDDEDEGCCSAGWWESCCTGNEEPL